MKTIQKKLRYIGVLIVCLFVCFILVLNFSDEYFSAFALESGSLKETKIYSDATIDGDFADDKVIVVLSHRESMRAAEYSLHDFSEIDIAEIEDLSQPVKKVLQKEETIYSENGDNIIIRDDFQSILCLTLRTPGKENVLNAIKTLEQREEIISAEPDYVLYPNQEPNDAYYDSGSQWALNGTNGIHAPSAWKITTGSQQVQVGVIDSGIDATHDDLKNRVNISLSRDFTNSNSSAASDTNSHGTHVAGIIGAEGNNMLGITGVNWNVQLVSLKINDGENIPSSMFSSRLVSAVEYATAVGIPILNNSNGSNNFTESSNALTTALREYPGIFITSAGNNGMNNDANSNRFPSNIDLPNVISVGALKSNGERLADSNYGANTVGIYAPGELIFSTVPGGYEVKSGTSMAAPHVTGVAALMLSLDSTLTGAELKQIILGTADDITISTPNGGQTVKKLNAYNSVNAASSSVRRMFGGGTGTDSDPFLIKNETQLKSIVYAYRPFYITNVGYVSRISYSFKLMNDITVSGQWTPPDKDFAGHFDGNGHSITYRMTLMQGNISPYRLGFFGNVIIGADIKNLTFKNCSISNADIDTQYTYSDSGGYIAIGILAGSISSMPKINNIKIQDCTIECNVKKAAVGGIAGWFSGATIQNCTVSGGSLTSYDGAMGGMAGVGDVARIEGGSISDLTITKNNYSDSDKIGEVIGDFFEANSGPVTVSTSNITINRNRCIAEGTLITLADGRQVPVESLKGDELLLVWNLYTGEYDVAPILFIDSDPRMTYRVINLSFSNGTSVKVISEHGFYDYNLNKYVYLDENAAEYIGHWFNLLSTDEDGNFVSGRVQLTDVSVQAEETVAYSPVTYGHLCYFVNGMLSMPGGIGGLFNIFEVDPDTMRYDEAAMAADIEEYGLFTYEEFFELVPVSETVFEAFNAQYLKVAIGKGLTDPATLQALAQRYAEYLGAI